MTTLASMSLFKRNNKNSGFQYAIGFSLKKMGIDSTALDLLNLIGLTPSSRQLQRKLKNSFWNKDIKGLTKTRLECPIAALLIFQKITRIFYSYTWHIIITYKENFF